MYCYKSFTSQDGLFIQNQITPGATTYASIDPTGNIQTLSTIIAGGNISTTSNISANSITLPANSINDSYLSSNIPLKNGVNAFSNNNTFITQANTNNSTLAATTAYVKSNLLSYALLNPPALQTWGTNENTFTTQINSNAGIRFVDTFTSKISQSGNALVIENISNVNSVQIRSTTAGLVQRTGLLIENGITCTLQGGSGNTITITGLNTPTLGIPPVAGVYSNEIATTSWVNTEISGNFALLNPPTLQYWGTNQNQFSTQITMDSVATRYINASNSSSIMQQGNNLLIQNITNANRLQLRTNSAGGAVRQNILCRNGNEKVI